MKFTKSKRSFLKIFLCILMTNLPHIALAESSANSTNLASLTAQPQMISTMQVLAEYNRQDAENEIRDFLSKSQISVELKKQGLTTDQISQRLANLSEQELQQMSTQVKEARAGGDILVAILLVVLILFLVKRL